MEVTSLKARIYGIIWQIDDYIDGGAPGGHSITQRWEFWKTGLNLLKANPIMGVGTGDIFNEMKMQYEADGTLLVRAYWKHPHNQFLSIAIAFGLLGLIWFLWSLFYPLYYYRANLDFVVIVFVLISLLSMMTEDTIETQAGVSFVAFFYSLFLFSHSQSKENVEETSEEALPTS